MHGLAGPPRGVLRQAPPGEAGTGGGGVGEAPSSGWWRFPTDIPFFTSAILALYVCFTYHIIIFGDHNKSMNRHMFKIALQTSPALCR